MSAIINFDSQINDYVQNGFSYYGTSNYKNINPTEDLINLFTLKEKVIAALPRRVEISTELVNQLNNQYASFSPIVNYLKLLFLNGGELNQHQSKQVLNYKTPDHLIFDWKIYHLHLNDKKTKHNYFVDRTDELLFVYIDNEQALFLGIFTHKPKTNFSNISLLEIIDNNWKSILPYRTDIGQLSVNFTDEERLSLRENNINVGTLQVNGKYISQPNFGQVSSGKSAAAAMLALKTMRWLNANLKAINKNVAIANTFFKQSHNIKDDINFNLVFSLHGPCIVDKNTNTVLVKWNDFYKTSINNG